MSTSLRIAARAIATVGLGLVLAGATAAPALAGETGVITRPFGQNYPTKSASDDQGSNAMASQHADGWNCLKQSDGKWDGWIYWYTS